MADVRQQELKQAISTKQRILDRPVMMKLRRSVWQLQNLAMSAYIQPVSQYEAASALHPIGHEAVVCKREIMSAALLTGCSRRSSTMLWLQGWLTLASLLKRNNH